MKHNNCLSDHIIYQTKGKNKSYCPHVKGISDQVFIDLRLFFANKVRNREERGYRAV